MSGPGGDEDGAGPGVHFKPLRLGVEKGEWVVLAIFEPGTRIPLHYHTGPAEVCTLAGSWNYVEYPDQPQTAGSRSRASAAGRPRSPGTRG